MADHRTFEIDQTQKKLWSIWLSPGVAPRNVVALFYSGAMAVGFVNLLNLIQPLLLQVQLGMTEGEGNFTALMYIALEVTTVIVAAPLANLSDLIGRRPIFATGFMIICLGLVMLPTADTALLFGIIRVFISVGVACCMTMIASIMADYPQNASRGKLISTNGIFTALGIIVIGSGLTQVPKVFESMGYSPSVSAAYTLWIGGFLAAITAVVCFTGLRKGRVSGAEEERPFMENMRIGLREIGGNPKLVLGCGATLLSRGDLTVLASFFSLWVQKAGTDIGIESVTASAASGRLFGLMQASMLIFMPIMGILADRLNRVTTLCVGMSVAAIGYLALSLSPNPFESNLIYVAVVLAGFGEAAMIVSVPALIGQEAPAASRGAIIGVAAIFGALGIIATNWVAGTLFDTVSYQAPFAFMVVLNCVMLLWAVSVRLRH